METKSTLLQVCPALQPEAQPFAQHPEPHIPSGQTMPQPPQLFGSAMKSMASQLLRQQKPEPPSCKGQLPRSFWPLQVWYAQLPWMHVPPVRQASAQVPQLAGSSNSTLQISGFVPSPQQTPLPPSSS